MRPIHRLLFGYVCCVLILITPCSPAWAAPKSIMVFPLAIHAESSMDYVKKGLADLMETKLTESKITVTRAPETLDEKNAVTRAKGNHAEALIVGSLTFLGESISINMELISTETGETLAAYSRIETEKGKLFNHINNFIAIIVGPVAAVTPAATEAGASPPTAEPKEAAILSKGMIRSVDLKTTLVSLTVGDVTGNGKKDIVLADIHDITVLSFEEDTLTETGRIKGPSFLNIIHMDAWDTDGNGIDEIIATAVHARNGKVSSYVYALDGGEYIQVCKNLDWFFKKTPCPFTGIPILLGQQQQFNDGHFEGPLQAMVWDDSTKALVPTSPCNESLKTVNLYTYATGDLHHKGNIDTITYTSGDYLSLLKSADEELWSSSERFGGSLRYILAGQQSPPGRYYLPPRLETGDFNGDGRIDVATLQNKNASPRMLTNLKKFVEGQVVCLTFETLDFKTLWKTAKVPGYIADFSIIDLDGNGILDLVYCVVPKKSSIFGKTYSYVVVQSLPEPAS